MKSVDNVSKYMSIGAVLLFLQNNINAQSGLNEKAITDNRESIQDIVSKTNVKDLNKDGIVDYRDLIAGNFLHDFNNDGVVTKSDIITLSNIIENDLTPRKDTITRYLFNEDGVYVESEDLSKTVFIYKSGKVFNYISYGQKDSYSTDVFDKIENKCDPLEEDSTLSQSEWKKIHNQCMIERWTAFLPIVDKEINRRRNLLISAINNKDNEQTVDSLKNSLLDVMSKKDWAEIDILSREEELKNSK